jgi:hypothetical protein
VPGGDELKDPLDEIIKAFIERCFQGWEATPKEQRVRFIRIAQHVVNDSNYETQVVKNPDKHNSLLALEKLIQFAINTAKEALMCRGIMAFRYSTVCRVRHAHRESTACMLFSVRTAHPALGL